LQASIALCCSSATAVAFFYPGEFSPFLSTSRWTEFAGGLQRVLVMLLARTITTFASVAAVACCLFAFSWVGLALLGF
jgi:hypothetical protein